MNCSKNSDFITIHTPLNATTKSIITEKEIALMKPSVRIINCARGGLIDEELLAKAITEKRIAGAAIDVFTKEPITESPLFSKDNVIVTPHLGASTAEAQGHCGQRCRRADRRCAERQTGPLCRQYPVRHCRDLRGFITIYEDRYCCRHLAQPACRRPDQRFPHQVRRRNCQL